MKFALAADTFQRFTHPEIFRRITGRFRHDEPTLKPEQSRKAKPLPFEADNPAEYEVTPFGRRRKTVARRHRIVKRSLIGGGLGAVCYVIWLLI